MAESLVKGIAYHGNRMLAHVREDMRELADSGFNAVLHMVAPDRTWYANKAAFECISQRHRDAMRAAARNCMGLK